MRSVARWRVSDALAATPILLFVAAWSPAKAGAIYATGVSLVLFTSGVAYLYVLEIIQPQIRQRGQRVAIPVSSSREETG